MNTSKLTNQPGPAGSERKQVTQSDMNLMLKNNSTGIKCEKCESNIFVEKMLLRRISQLVTGASKDQIVPIPVPCCAACGHINKEFEPQFDRE